MNPIQINGSTGEGGGQVLRSALTLSMLTGRPFAIRRIRSRRRKPGLLRQHLTAVRAAQAVCGAEVTGDAIGSMELSFRPGAVRPGEHRFAVGTAGSATLVLQTVLPALALASGSSRLELEGGTHNPMAPPFDFLVRTYLPLLERMGPRVRATLLRPGFYPAGGGEMRVEIEPAERLEGFDLLDGGEIRGRRGRALLARLPRHIGEREIKTLQKRTGWPDDAFSVEQLEGSRGPGNAVLLEVEREHVTEVFIGFGEVGKKAEAVASTVVKEMRAYLAADVPVGEHLADQLLLLFAVAGRGSFRTLPLSMHSQTQIEILRTFLEVEITVETPPGEEAGPARLVRVGRAG